MPSRKFDPDPTNWSMLRAIFSGILNPFEGGCHEAEAVFEEQIAFALRQAESGTTIEEICRKMGVSEPTFYRWKKVYAGMGVAEVRRLKQLEEENAKLKRVVADLTLDKAMLQDVLRKNGKARRPTRDRTPSADGLRRRRTTGLQGNRLP